MFPVIRLSSDIYVSTYFLVIALAYAICVYWIAKRSRMLTGQSKDMMDLSLMLMICGFIGARLFHVFYELPDYYAKKPMDIFKFWQGGFVFYGGILGATLPSLLFVKLKKLNLKNVLDILAPVVPLGYAIGRFATLLSGSGFGRPTDLPWGITYPEGTEAPLGIALHPTPIYSMLWNISIVALVLVLQKKIKPYKAFFVMVACHGAGRLIIEQFRDDYRGSLFAGLTVSSWISLFLIVGSISFLVYFSLREKQYNKASS